MAQVSEISFQFLLLNIRRHEYVPRRLRFAFRSRIRMHSNDLVYAGSRLFV